MRCSYEKNVLDRLDHLEGAHESIGMVKYNGHSYDIPVVRMGSETAQICFLSAGIHGNEHGAVYALLDFLKFDARKYLDQVQFLAFPCLNPGGFETNRRTNPNKSDVNRDCEKFKEQETNLLSTFLNQLNQTYALVWNAHEDPTRVRTGTFPLSANPREFFMYEGVAKGNSPIGAPIIKAVERAGFSVWKEPVYGETNDDGLVVLSGRHHDDGVSLDEYMLKYSGRVFIPETPTCWPMNRRIKVQRMVLNAAVQMTIGNFEKSV